MSWHHCSLHYNFLDIEEFTFKFCVMEEVKIQVVEDPEEFVDDTCIEARENEDDFNIE